MNKTKDLNRILDIKAPLMSNLLTIRVWLILDIQARIQEV